MKTKNLYKNLITISLIVASTLISGCGGGGGGGGSDYIGAAIVSIYNAPSEIDTAGRTKVTSEISEVHENGIDLKFRFPKGLSYVKESSYLEVDGQKIGIDPDVYKSSGSFKYLVYFLSRDAFGRSNYGEVTFELRGESEVKDGRIEVDADVDDPRVPDSEKFSVDNPEFSAEADTYIAVVN